MEFWQVAKDDPAELQARAAADNLRKSRPAPVALARHIDTD
jgi:hypothetical protein